MGTNCSLSEIQRNSNTVPYIHINETLYADLFKSSSAGHGGVQNDLQVYLPFYLQNIKWTDTYHRCQKKGLT